MKNAVTFKTPLIAAILLSATAAWADVKPTDVWGDWKSQLAGYGYDISAQENMSGGDLQITDLKMNITLPEDEGTVDVALTGVKFHDNGDGTVSVQLPAIMPIDVHVEAKDENPVDITVNYTTTGLAMVVSGTPENMTTTYSAASMGMALAGIVESGNPVEMGDANFTLNNVSGNSSTGGTDIKTRKQDFRAESLFYLIDMANPDNAADKVMLKGQLNGLSSNFAAEMPKGVDFQDMAAALAAGFSVDGTFAHQGGQAEFAFSGDGDNASGSGSSKSGQFTVQMNSDKLGYAFESTGAQMTMQVPDLPFPVELAMAKSGFAMDIPVAQSDEPQDFRLAFTLGDFTISDMIWGMFDPAGQLPRDPATIAIDLVGKAKVMANIFDPAEMETIGEAAPGELHALDVKDLTVRAVGAELTGKGAFTFDNTDMVSFDGMPRPEGVLNLALSGGNALLDKLVAMGFIPEDDAMGTRMMIGMFAVPGDGPDSLKSTIEINDQGHVLANGQRLK
ncbi:DUF2125 domain-containing protein [Thalassovita sp.]|uniref:DUF2125 domain-containing protein n=1 Tax=Thalassovita sp. TaxID=1979401 RepID=UPI002B2725C3|nr:DUF2125 domain-containing protein [Thalassovita sp.]